MHHKDFIVITGRQLQNRYFLNHLNSRFPIKGVFIEGTRYPEPAPRSEREQQAWEWFFSTRAQYERQTLGPSDGLPLKNVPEIIRVSRNGINSPDYIEKIKTLNPGLIVLFGASLLGRDLMDSVSGYILNLHVGLPERYRGSSCNFWPVYHQELDGLGACVHRVDGGIDSGNILLQDTIQLEEKDHVHSLIAKTVILGTRLMIESIKAWRRGALSFRPAKSKGQLFLKKHFDPRAVLQVREMEEKGEIQNLIREQIPSKSSAGKKVF